MSGKGLLAETRSVLETQLPITPLPITQLFSYPLPNCPIDQLFQLPKDSTTQLGHVFSARAPQSAAVDILAGMGLRNLQKGGTYLSTPLYNGVRKSGTSRFPHLLRWAKPPAQHAGNKHGNPHAPQ